jgi:hypothetical protein
MSMSISDDLADLDFSMSMSGAGGGGYQADVPRPQGAGREDLLF